ncbi:DUF881 domain-containing protein [Alkaliphilus serpentinus]|uniref:DUF881 domain-containing protein n=1 Tax=Alkaliphilus serpentinus TaxID=1482731 RepID=A0A833HMG0_9FIRM|nr:DUF881 domain-containing protein [Alkaliphilus serpentinus]KAB3527598.1 DUF881 domain-containing protein [Alkaliphilus serpentinus]
MKKIKQNIILGFLLLLLGFIIAAQFQNVRKVIGEDLLSVSKARQLLKELNEISEEKTAIQEEISKLEGEIKKLEESEMAESYIIQNLQNELSKYQIFAGTRTLEGPGIVVTISEPSVETDDAEDSFYYDDSIVVYYKYLLGIINDLNIAGAEAITINDQRYLATTEIRPNVDNLIINGVPVTPPINIAAIGDPDELEATMNIPFGLIQEEIKLYTNLQVNVKRHNNIVVPRYSRVQGFQYAKPIE